MTANTKPDNYASIQQKWCQCRNESIQMSARVEAAKAVKKLDELQLPREKILVIGPQHGYELEQFRRDGVNRLLGIDPVESFCDDCRQAGFTCMHICAEELNEYPEWFGGAWGCYASHALEHCYDLAKTARNIQMMCEWCYAVVPIEPQGGKDAAHFSRIKSTDTLPSLFCPPWQVAWQSHSPPRHDQKSNGRYLFVKPQNASPDPV